MKPFLCCLLLLLLNSCSVYHKIFHPYRLPTPKPSPEFLAQQKAKKSGGFPFFRRRAARPARGAAPGAPEEAATDVSTPSGGALAAPGAPAAPAEPRALPERSTVRYDKQGLMKKPRLLRRRLNKPAKPFHPWQSIRQFFKFKRHAKPNYSPDHRPAPKPVPDTPAPDAPPGAAPAGKP